MENKSTLITVMAKNATQKKKFVGYTKQDDRVR